MKIFKSFKKFKKKTAIIFDNNLSLSYEDILFKTNKIKKNVFKRSLILIISENSIGSLLSYLFCVLNNHVALIIDNKTSLENIDKIIINYNPNYIFASKILKKI